MNVFSIDRNNELFVWPSAIQRYGNTSLFECVKLLFEQRKKNGHTEQKQDTTNDMKSKQ